ncbi:MAG: acyl-CoA dehydrogenase family protein [Myxococcota bacterium]|nr:acyl-CoA dehydrogenase family protein [Myxococcota bacterium]
MSNPFDTGGGFLPVDGLEFSIVTPEQFSEEQQAFAQATVEFMEREILPHRDALEAKDFDLMREMMAKAGEMGLLAIEIPEKDGGLGLDLTTACIVAEKIATDSNFATTHLAHTGIGTLPIVYFANEHTKAMVLPKAASGEWVGAYCLTEPGSGSDALAARTQAISVDGGFSVTGNKQFITNGGFADYYTVFAQVNPSSAEGGRNFTGFLALRSEGGIEPQAEEHKMGVRGSSTTPVRFEECFIPANQQLGEEGKGHRIAFGILNIGRLKLGAASVGGAKIALGDAITYTKERKQFGRSIADFRLTKHKIGTMAADIYAAESILYRCSGDIDRNIHNLDAAADDFAEKKIKAIEEFALECAVNKVYGSEVLSRVVDECVQLHGGYGFISEYPIERAYRDSRINRIWEGTNEVNRMLIPGTLMRRVMRGKLMSVMQFQQQISQALASGDLGLPDYEGAAAPALKIAAQLRRLSIFVSGLAAAKFDRKIVREQVALVACADLMIQAYTVDSAARRAAQSGSELQCQLANLHAAMTVDQARSLANRTLKDIDAREAMGLISPLLDDGDLNLTELAYNVSVPLLDAGAYAV